MNFHSDLSYMPRPGTISLLQAIEMPQEGGQTQWCDCRAAHDALPEAQRQQLATLRAVDWHPVPEQNPRELASHPIIRLHPETGRASLYVSPHLTSHVEGIGQSESPAILDGLYAHMGQPQRVWTHQWQVGDLLMWDNRPTTMTS